MKKNIPLILTICIALLLTSCGFGKSSVSSKYLSDDISVVKAAVLYDGNNKSMTWKDTYSQLNQSLMLNLSVEAIDINKAYDLGKFDILYPDKNIIASENKSELKNDIEKFVQNGGAVFLDNCFKDFFDKDFIGAKEYKKIENYPENLVSENSNEDYWDINSIVTDFAKLNKGYYDFNKLSTYDYGYAVVPSTSETLIKNNDGSLYTMNKYKKGIVFYTNPVLPNTYSINGFSLESHDEKQVSVANTTATANQIILNKFAEYISKVKYGFSVSRVFGCYGRPSMAWELHYEEMTGIQNNAGIIFGELAKEYNQIPSYSLIRNAFKWFSRFESVTYLLGQKKDDSNAIDFPMDYYENAYSSGTHVVSDNKWLTINEINKAGSYFVDEDKYTQGAYPVIDDINDDGINDIITGSSDGNIYTCIGTNNNDRFTVDKATKLCDNTNNELKVESYSSPTYKDVNGDNQKDIVCGSGQGKIYVAYSNGANTYSNFSELVDTGLNDLCFPEVGDLNHDGNLDLIVGTNQGKLLCYYGNSSRTLSTNKPITYNMSDIKGYEDIGTRLSPRLYDFDNDGKEELYLGTFDGYIAKLEYKDANLVGNGYIASSELNYKENNRIKFGNNCVPSFRDINNDSIIDLIAGELEYGLAYPIDSPYFPYAKELKEQIAYMQENGFYIQPHFYTNVGASADRENFELTAHKKAFEYYGIDLSNAMGTNQHTWRISEVDDRQTLLSIFNNKLYWNSGFEPANTKIIPQIAKENIIGYPFYLLENDEKTTMIQNCSVLGYGADNQNMLNISAKYNSPLCMYYHCDFIYESDTEAKTFMQTASDFQKKNNYNFVMENQLMFANAAAYNLDLSITRNKKDKFNITFTPKNEDNRTALYNKDYAMASGCKISLAKSLKNVDIATDADVVYRQGHDIYVSANRAFSIYETNKSISESKIRRVNLPADIKVNSNGCELNFKEGGMMQCVIEGKVKTTSEGWKVYYDGENTTFTKYGDKTKLIINY